MALSCAKCGACCRSVGHAVKGAREMVSGQSAAKTENSVLSLVAEFPHEIKDDGSCALLNEANECSVYADRPTVCRASEMYEMFWKSKMSEDEYLQLAGMSCAALRINVKNRGDVIYGRP